MPATLATLESSRCPITRSVSLLGDRWSLLIVRDVLGGLHRFDELASHLKISRAVLSPRLAGLVDAGILERADYREPGARRRAEYRLTESGQELVPILAALVDWGRRHVAGSAGLRLAHTGCLSPVHVEMGCAAGHAVPNAQLRIDVPPGH